MVVEHTDYGESQPDKIIRLIDCVIINTNINSYESTDEEGNVRTCWEADADTSVSFLLSCIQGRHCHLSKFHIYVLVYCIGVFLSGL